MSIVSRASSPLGAMYRDTSVAGEKNCVTSGCVVSMLCSFFSFFFFFYLSSFFFLYFFYVVCLISCVYHCVADFGEVVDMILSISFCGRVMGGVSQRPWFPEPSAGVMTAGTREAPAESLALCSAVSQ